MWSEIQPTSNVHRESPKTCETNRSMVTLLAREGGGAKVCDTTPTGPHWEPAAEQCPDERAGHENAAREKAGAGDGHVEPAVEHGRQPEGVGREHEIEDALGENCSAQRRDAHEVYERSQ